MKRLLLVTALLAASTANAQIFIPPPGIPLPIGALEITQLRNYLELITSRIIQAEQLATAIRTYNEIVRTGHMLTAMQWTDALRDIANLGQIVQVGQGLAYSTADLDSRFQNAFPGFGSRAINTWEKYSKWSQITLDTIRGVIRGNAIAWPQIQTDQGMIHYFQSEAQGLQTQMQALQIGNQVGVETLNQLTKLRADAMATAQAAQVVNGYWMQKEMDTVEAQSTFFAKGRAGRDGVGIR